MGTVSFDELLRLVPAVTPPLSVVLRKGVIAGNPLPLHANLLAQMEHE